jgi:hypothetical protein
MGAGDDVAAGIDRETDGHRRVLPAGEPRAGPSERPRRSAVRNACGAVRR